MIVIFSDTLRLLCDGGMKLSDTTGDKREVELRENGFKGLKSE
uniref:Uncharacterized protein n=1 Tax=Lepeophtheirus salmonis TaxID=72036 RepID=A0A0K2VLQ4_LEPSM